MNQVPPNLPPRHYHHEISPWFPLITLARNQYLVRELVKRDVVGRYRGSVLGLLWSFCHPLVMLLVYTFVFGVVFRSRWSGMGQSQLELAMILFTGLTVFTLFSELINRSPVLIVSNVNLVKKVVFPLEILPYVALGTSLFHTLVSFLILLTVGLIANGTVVPTFFLFPVVLFPLLPLSLGISWFLASLGTYLRDAAQAVAVITQVLLFMTPIFYPISAVPEEVRIVVRWNPLAFIVEQMRRVVVLGQVPDWTGLVLSLAFGVFVSWLGLIWFQKTRNGFANAV
ncbi:MAG: ABC transporter permease [Acidobacteriota bacterium]